MRVRFALAAFLVACSSGARAPQPGPTPVQSPAPLEATSIGLWSGKPPMRHHYFDVVLRNPSTEPRWLILPSVFPYEGDTSPAPGGNEVELQSFVVSDHPRAVVLLGVAGHFWAIQMIGSGEIRLRRLAIQSWWEKVPPTVSLEMMVARDLRIGDRAIADLIGFDPASATGADVMAPRDAADKRARSFWHPDPALPGLPIELDVESRARIDVALRTDLLSP